VISLSGRLLRLRICITTIPLLLSFSLVAQDRRLYDHGALVREDPREHSLYLIFSGHEYADGGEVIRDVLRRHAVSASFFFTGDFYRDSANSAIIRGLLADGHYLGAHSDRHLLYASWECRDSLLVSREEFRRDLADNYRSMQTFGIRREDAPVFLPPYEWYNDSIAVWTRAEGLTLINYTPGTPSHADYTTPLMGARYLSTDSIFARILRHEQLTPSGLNGFILLLHIGTHSDRTDKFYHRLDELLSVLKEKGYGFKRFAPVRPGPPER